MSAQATLPSPGELRFKCPECHSVVTKPLQVHSPRCTAAVANGTGGFRSCGATLEGPSIWELECVNTRGLSILSNAGIHHVQQLPWQDLDYIAALPGFGKRSLEQLEKALKEQYGLEVGQAQTAHIARDPDPGNY
jgi:hypothetical protein